MESHLWAGKGSPAGGAGSPGWPASRPAHTPSVWGHTCPGEARDRNHASGEGGSFSKGAETLSG